MQYNKKLVSICKKKLRRGQGAFSRAVDYIALRAIAFMLCFLYFASIVANTAAQVLLSIAATGFISVAMDLLQSLRLDSLIKRERAAAKEAEFERRLSLLPEKKRSDMIRRYISINQAAFTKDKLVCTVHRSCGVMEEDIIKAARSAIGRSSKKAVLFHCGPLTPEAKKQLKSCREVQFELISIKDILNEEERAALTPTTEEADESLITAYEQAQEQKRMRPKPFSPAKTGRYIWASACLMGLSFFVQFSLYYRLMAGACLLFAIAARWAGSAKQQ